MKQVGFLPLGTVVVLKGNARKILIVQQEIHLTSEEEDSLIYFDYAAIVYPEGLSKEGLIYFNHHQILSVIAEGYSEDESISFLEEMDSSLKTADEKEELDSFLELQSDLNDEDAV